jgi:glutathione peroxidase
MAIRPAPVLIFFLALLAVSIGLWGTDRSAIAQSPQETPVIDHTVLNNAGEEVSLADYRGQVLLIVNTASECGLTPQLETLELLYQRYKDRGFSVLAFPSNDFGGQEPGTNEEIEEFYCNTAYNVTFPIFDKVPTTGDAIVPLYRALTQETTGDLQGAIGWNFTKFLVDAEGRVVARFGPRVDPMDEDIRQAIEALLPEA